MKLAQDYRGNFMSAHVDFQKHNKAETLRYKPRAINTLDDLSVEANAIIGERKGILEGTHRKFATFGSCFAVNVAEALKARGAQAYTTHITEDVNCPFNNVKLLRRVFLGETSDFTTALANETDVDYEEIYKEFRDATDIIFTLGNIFHLPNSAVVSKDGVPLVKESFEESVEYISDIVWLLKKHTAARIFVSVSPVPISGYRGPDFDSVMEADCASKCQLRAAIGSISGVTYIPTFEVFRWLSAHQSFPTFGYDNGNQRHIQKEQINAVMELLC